MDVKYTQEFNMQSSTHWRKATVNVVKYMKIKQVN